MLIRGTIFAAGVNVGLNGAMLIDNPTNGVAWFVLLVFVFVGAISIWGEL